MVAEELEMLNLGEEGYLLDPADWNEDVARTLAADEDIELSDEHWRVLRFMREYHAEHGIAADARFVIKFLAEELGYGDQARSRLFQLFPYGYVKQACKIAGMQRPRAWSTG
ncbi:MAG: TusE/DsrC/DsvC family sulfur relay protein [Gammaproteobacteria bacterium]